MDEAKPSSSSKIDKPPTRQWIKTDEINTNEVRPSGGINVMCSNLLSDRYTTGEPVQGYEGQLFKPGEIHNRAKYSYCPDEYLDWDYRKNLLLREIEVTNPDVACLQEVEKRQFGIFFNKKLTKLGYKGVYLSRSSGNRKRGKDEANRVDGCAIFYKKDRLALVQTEEIDFNAAIQDTSEWFDTSVGDLCGGKDDCSQDETNEFAFQMTRLLTNQGCVALCAMFRTNYGFWPQNEVPEVNEGRHRNILVCNAHLESKFSMPDVRIIQAMVMVKRAKEMLNNYYDSQVVICGDLNALPTSGCLRYLTEGKISVKDSEFYNMPYENLLLKMFGKPNEDGYYTHDLGLATAVKPNVMSYSCLQPEFKGMLDHILYQKENFHMYESLSGPVDEEWLKTHQIEGAPSQHLPSDHFPLAAKLVLNPDTLQEEDALEKMEETCENVIKATSSSVALENDFAINQNINEEMNKLN